MLSGAQIMVKSLESEGVSVLFGYPGATICPFFDALHNSSIDTILVRQEQNAGHAASGYARAKDTVGVCAVTSGPGATNLITGIATAYMDSIPLVAITGQVDSKLIGRDVFQEADITGACEPFTKHSYLVEKVEDIPRIFKEAFHIASTGRPGPVLIDIPQNIQTDMISDFKYPDKVDIVGYKPKTNGHIMQIKRAIEAIKNAKRPVICAGGGVIRAKGKKELMEFAEKTFIPVVTTMMGIGSVPSEHELYLGMLGTHGKKSANKAISQTDLLILCGARVGDRAVAAPNQVAENAVVIHIDIDPAEIGKNMKAHIPIVGDIKKVLTNLVEMCDFRCDEDWVNSFKEMREQAEMIYPQSKDGYVEPKAFMEKLSLKMKDNAIYLADVGQNQIWSSNWYKVRKGLFLTSGGLGTMGYSVPAAVGAKLAKPKRQVVAVCGDGSFQMSLCELATIVQHNVGVKIIVMRNNRLGMVRELQDNFYEGRYAITSLDGSPDFTKLAEAYGIKSAYIDQNSQVDEALQEMFKDDDVYLLVCNVDPKTPSR